MLTTDIIKKEDEIRQAVATLPLVRAFKSYISHGESGTANLDLFRTQIKQIQTVLEDFDPDNIYNCDETGLFLKAMSSKTIVTGPVRGKKITRIARVSVLCSNATGVDKRSLYVLSKHRPSGLAQVTSRAIEKDHPRLQFEMGDSEYIWSALGRR
ncbi:hypothetical protein BGZ54_000244 [Gamsiella multidivaricata]|nr:hypothetical protein BGZ54_000244 [Gamsiella multidivaricata]